MTDTENILGIALITAVAYAAVTKINAKLEKKKYQAVQADLLRLNLISLAHIEYLGDKLDKAGIPVDEFDKIALRFYNK